ncbi:hypothetical protein KR032_000078, partial [Drosophila birchii]
LVMFPKSFKVGNNKLHPIWKKDRLNLFPKITKHNETDDQTIGDTSRQTEMTVPKLKVKTDKLGNILFEKWAVTHGDNENPQKVYHRGRPSIPKYRDYIPFYYDNKKKELVCQFRSTEYVKPEIVRFLNMRVYDRIHPIRMVWMELRELIFKEGNSLECHQPSQTVWTNYTMCALLRNMRMEYLIPMYPLRQRGYY